MKEKKGVSVDISKIQMKEEEDVSVDLSKIQLNTKYAMILTRQMKVLNICGSSVKKTAVIKAIWQQAQTKRKNLNGEKILTHYYLLETALGIRPL